MHLRVPVKHATLLLLAMVTIYGCTGGGGGGGAVASDDPVPTPTTPPLARFSATPVSGTAPLIVQFTDQSDLGGEVFANYTWVFGDGGVSTEKSPVHTYQFAGVYTVTLFVSTAVGTSTETKTDLVTVSLTGPPPVPEFSASPTLGVAPLTVQFTNQSDLGGFTFAVYSWDFGDGRSSIEQHPLHQYSNVGLYTVSLTVSTAGGTGIETKIDFIQAIPFVLTPIADFSAIPQTGKPPLGVQFTNLSNLNGAESATYLWDFGDGQTSIDEHPLHTYGSLGLFTVSLTTTTRGGVDTETKLNFIDVRFPRPMADFSATPTSGDPPLHVQFMDLSDLKGAPGATYLWNFGDGATSTAQDPAHDYTVGSFTVSLTVTTLGGTDTAIKTNLIVTNKSRNFILTFEDNLDLSPLLLSVFVSSEVTTSGQVSIPGLVPSFLQTFSVVPGTATEISIPIEAMIKEIDATTVNGIAISADDPINVYGLNREEFSTDGFAVFPVETLGTEYFVMSVTSTIPLNQGGNGRSHFAIVANEDNTTVQITPTISTGIRTGNVTYTVTLDRLEVYQLQTNEDLADLTGTRIVSDRPVAVFSGDLCGQVPAGVGACDHLVEQLPPVNAWGTDVITVPLATRVNGDTFRILAAQDGTTVTIAGASPETISLNAGQFAERVFGSIHRISADRPILVAQFANSARFDGSFTNHGDPFMMIVMPAERFLDAYTFATPSSVPDTRDFDNHINIVAPGTDAAAGLILLDGVSVDPVRFTAVPGTIFAAAQVPVTPGSHTVTAPDPFGLYIYGFTVFFESYGFNGGMAF
ncbi:MAG: PKD domain-containing protein [Candidatus Hydrogenedentes bacterium]|nr:PKD domain-containing protein [Candidatus Hydrogenedentota bacterium]